MIQLIPDMPDYVAAFIAKAEVTKQDYENVLMPQVDKVSKAFGKINFLLVLDTSVRNYTLGAWFDDIVVGVKHITKWHRVAIVSRQGLIKKVTNIFGHLVPGEYKGFAMNELNKAITWVSSSKGL